MSETKKPWGFWKTAIIYGSSVGLLIICTMLASFTAFGIHSSAGSMIVGFALMFFYMSLIFFGIKRYRNVEQGGVIKFSKALGLGVAMAVFSALAYTLVWEVYVAFNGDEFINGYTDMLIEKQKEAGVQGAELAEFITKQKDYVAKYANRSFRMPVTFSENFPVGFIVALVSALALHNPKFWARN